MTRWQSIEIAVNRKFIIEIAQAKIKRRMLARILRDKAQHRTGEESIETSAMKITVIEHEFWARFTRARAHAVRSKRKGDIKELTSNDLYMRRGRSRNLLKITLWSCSAFHSRSVRTFARWGNFFGKLARNIIRKLKLKVGWGVMAAKAWN